jgi:alkylhydroperoxidase/carboxymuconolactone decarboxylase family protein YurZ
LSLIGERMANEAILATGAAWTDDFSLARDRSLVVLAALAVGGGVEARSGRTFAGRLTTARRRRARGLPLLAVYAGYPKASVAIEIFREVIAEYNAAH